MKKKILNMLGLAMKAGCVASGETAAENALIAGTARFLILAADASANSRKHFADMARFRKLPYTVWGSKEELGHAIGKAERSAVILTDQGFAGRISEMIPTESTEEQ